MATFLLIPGAGGSAWYWHRVVPELRSRGHRAVAVELPAGDPAADLHSYARTCVDAYRNACAGSPSGGTTVVVGQSLGGFTVPLVAEQIDSDRIVLVNAMLPLPHETPGHWFENSGAGEARAEMAVRDGRDVGAGIDPMNDFFHDVPDDVVADAMAQGEPDQAGEVMGSVCTFDEWPAPVTVVGGAEDRFFPIDFQRRQARERLGADITVLPGGHLIALSRPVELADVLLAVAGDSD
ncbi:alpha/beta fold hydrolase [Gordonia sp. LSe1-13]|uniref:Alpha/beta fold hydrolase n=1 Tax=Gordonia sesuvii TaxID=3116777 RepID=A0ABU7MID9_9ACTN|nr:alpha/beta fold hydrolase [Gordonia sp. LSe1-13]